MSAESAPDLRAEIGHVLFMVHAALGSLYAGLGEKEDALREATRAIELEGDDRYFVPSAQEILARIEVQVGDPSHALDLLPEILKAHYFSWVTGVPLTPALLRLDPVWDPLRNDPRVQRVIEDQASEIGAILRGTDASKRYRAAVTAQR